jgi:TPP-dependent pyruvate/acetoin dehydrogenase alpha subunit
MDPLIREMLRIRRFEEEISLCYMSELEMRCPIHLCNGQEAVAVGVCSHLKETDWIFPPHRSHHWYLAKGGSMDALAAEMYGKKTGCSGGMGGSMHVVDTKVGISLSSSIVASNIPVAVGAAWAFKMKGTDQIAVAPCGDGALDEGVFWESLNFAALKGLPILFVLEDNGFATHSPIENRFRGSVASKVESFGMLSDYVKGNDPFKVKEKTEFLVRAVRFHRPALLHCQVHRWMEHVGPGEDFHLSYREENNIRQDQEIDVLKGQSDPDVDQGVKESFEFARSSPFPESCFVPATQPSTKM